MNYITIKNNGTVTEQGRRMTNQCLWIAIRDYFHYCHDQKYSIIEIKTLGELKLNSDYQMADWENLSMRKAIKKIAVALDIQLNFYPVYLKYGHSGDADPQRIADSRHIVNRQGSNIVNIAFYGAHFEFITHGPNISTCKPANKDNTFTIGNFKPDLTVVNPDINEQHKEDFQILYETLVDNTYEIDTNKAKLHALNLSEKTRAEINKDIERLINENKNLSYAISHIIDTKEQSPVSSVKKSNTNAILIYHSLKITKLNEVVAPNIIEYIRKLIGLGTPTINTVCPYGTPDYMQNGFGRAFINNHINQFDVVLIPDCTKTMQNILEVQESKQASDLCKLIQQIAQMVKPGGKLYLDKLIISLRVYNTIKFFLESELTFVILDEQSGLYEINSARHQ